MDYGKNKKKAWIFSLAVHLFVIVCVFTVLRTDGRKFYKQKIYKINLVKSSVSEQIKAPIAAKKEKKPDKIQKNPNKKPLKPKKRQIIKKKSLYSSKNKEKERKIERETLKNKLNERLKTEKSLKKQKLNTIASIQGEKFPYSWYDDLILRKIKSNWSEPASVLLEKDFLEVLVSFRISKAGEISNLFILDKSGYGPLDASAIQAVKISGPFPPLPKDFVQDSRQVNIKFELQR